MPNNNDTICLEKYATTHVNRALLTCNLNICIRNTKMNKMKTRNKNANIQILTT